MMLRTRNWLTAASAVGVLVTLAAVLGALSEPRSADPFLRRPSTFFTDASGARGLLLVMKRLLPSADQWRRPFNLLSSPGGRDSPSTLIVAGPARPISKSEAEHLDAWLSEGGQLILATDDGWPLGSSVPALKEPTEKESLQIETYLSRHAAAVRWSKPDKVKSEWTTGALVPAGGLNLQQQRSFASTEGAKIAAAAGMAALAIEIPVGNGRIVAIADPAIVSNRALREADNAVWLVALAAEWGNGGALVDEYHHGFGTRRTVSALSGAFLQTPWGWCVLQLAGAGLLYVFGYRRRFGRIRDPSPPARGSPLELVDARAGLFQTAAAQGLAIELIRQNLSHEIEKPYRKRLAPLDQKSRSSRGPGGAAGLSARLEFLSSKSARGEKLTDREFVEAGRIAGQIPGGDFS